MSEWLTAARNYWVCTIRPDGRPHAKPVWGVWLEDELLFSAHPETITARNLKANPALVAHLESGDQVAIVEGLERAGETLNGWARVRRGV